MIGTPLIGSVVEGTLAGQLLIFKRINSLPSLIEWNILDNESEGQ
jgi:hypothetical protein